VNDFGARSTSNGPGASSHLYRTAYSPGASFAPSVRQPPAIPKPRAFSNMNQSMDFTEVFVEESNDMGRGGDGGGEEEEDLEEQERKMLEMALQRSVQDVGVYSNSMMRPSRPSSRRSSTGSGARHPAMNMSMDLMSVFEEEPPEHMSSHRPEYDARMIREQEKNRYGYGSEHTGNHRADPRYGTDHCGRHQALPGTRSPERHSNEGADARLLAQQEEEMIRLAMERSMQDFTLPPQSPRRSSHHNPHGRSASMGMVANGHTRSHSADRDIPSYSYSRPGRDGRNDPPSPQRAYSAGEDDYGRRRDVRGARRPRFPRREPPAFRSNNLGELASVKEQEQEMFEQALAMSKQDYRRASTSHYN